MENKRQKWHKERRKQLLKADWYLDVKKTSLRVCAYAECIYMSVYIYIFFKCFIVVRKNVYLSYIFYDTENTWKRINFSFKCNTETLQSISLLGLKASITEVSLLPTLWGISGLSLPACQNHFWNKGEEHWGTTCHSIAEEEGLVTRPLLLQNRGRRVHMHLQTHAPAALGQALKPDGHRILSYHELWSLLMYTVTWSQAGST